LTCGSFGFTDQSPRCEKVSGLDIRVGLVLDGQTLAPNSAVPAALWPVLHPASLISGIKPRRRH